MRLAASLLLFCSYQYHCPWVVGLLSLRSTLQTRITIHHPQPSTLLCGTRGNQQQQQQTRQQKEPKEEDWGNHWIRPSAAANDDDVLDLVLEPSETESDGTIHMDVSVDGALLQTGPLSLQIDAALQSRLPDPVSRRALVAQMTAQQVLSVVLQHSGLELANPEEAWGTVEALYAPEQSGTFDSWEILAEQWQPGQTLSFLLRQVPTKRRSVSWETLRASLENPEFIDDTEDDDPPITTLAELKADHTRRVEQAPRLVDISSPYTGTDTRGYRALSARDIRHAQQLQAAGQSDHVLVKNVTRHVMHALVAHGCLLVEWTDADDATLFARMWEEVEALLDPNKITELPPLQKVSELDANTHIKVGFASYQDGQMQFVERRRRSDGTWLPDLPNADESMLSAAFDAQASLGRALVQLVVAASTEEVCGAVDLDRAVRLAQDWMDDGTSLSSDDKRSTISMSPHRLCRYQDIGGNMTDAELFGAHTDSSFLTAVPVAAVAGLEVYDEEAEQWYRPEAAARKHYSHSQHSSNNTSVPWYARYAVFMAGEWLQLVSGNQVAAAVHRVISANRTSAPVLLRARPEERFDVPRYFGVDPTNPAIWPVWKECQGRTLSEIHEALQ
jgi:hypothetical protein